MADVFLCVVTLLLLIGLGLVGYRYRKSIIRYAKDPSYNKEWRPDRKTILRRDIEDAEAEIDYLESKENKEEGE